MKNLTLIKMAVAALFFYSCGSGNNEETTSSSAPDTAPEVPESIAEGKGIGEIEEVNLEEELDEDMVKMGKAIYDMKCSACHKLTDQRVVGPGFQGVTNRRKPEWIMNMITNVDVMLDEDPAARAMLEECLTRMPNQNVSVGDARNILEFFRNNDVEKTGNKDQANS
ncbi:c-type cytochrome [Cyclobacterium plantarum]|uniref:Cytochrome c n=1 Tax=Cyclobacterium plantarum TaxID=2716263 RepID=A0ABX0H5M4_9BACT|nr:c-type cytochrome [Cyclobacterium plantarum]NHE57150.1 cytochrome c [Cyclobacterium plantarum]